PPHSIASPPFPAISRISPDASSSSPDQIPARAGSSNQLFCCCSLLRRQKEMMLYEIHSHAQIQDLQARSDELGHPEGIMGVDLVSLESVRIARESYALLCPLIKEFVFWGCPQLKNLSVVARLSLEIQMLEHDVLPQLKVQEAKLEQGALEALLLMKNSAIMLLHLRKRFMLALGVLLAEDDLVLARVKKLSIMLKDTADAVLKGDGNIAWLEERVLLLVQLVTNVLETPVRFYDPDEDDEKTYQPARGCCDEYFLGAWQTV
uniref:Uncharacterized protein n=2 Tax=Aegilops tauschii subsp. strangulata TaxID=200361 RepID=A0A452XCJ9_AEGTS